MATPKDILASSNANRSGATDHRPVVGLTSRTMQVRSSNRARSVETMARTFLSAIEAAGGRAILIPNSEDPSLAEGYLDLVNAIVFTGGDDPHPGVFGEDPHPNVDVVDERRDRFEFMLARDAHARGLPTLGVCRGIQMMNIALGGDIYQDLVTQADAPICHAQKTMDDGPWHEVMIEPGSQLAALLGGGRRRVNSYHHQAVRRLGTGLTVSAKTTGDGLIEALEDPEKPYFIGVQWHPELWPDDHALFEGLIQAARDCMQSASKGR